MARRKRKKVTEEEKQLFVSKSAAGMSCAAIGREMKRHEAVVRYWIGKSQALTLVSKTQQALNKANDNPMALALTGLVDTLLLKAPEVEEVTVRPKERKCRARVVRTIEFTV